MIRRLLPAVLALVSIAAMAGAGVIAFSPEWSADELKKIQSLSIASLPALPPDPSNRVADDPGAAALGKALFFDTRFSANGSISCASCHKPDRQFQDDLPVGEGMARGNRRTMPVAGTAYFPFLFWDGRKDSQWSQALGPLENPLEHGADRTMVVRLVANAYESQYEALFGPLPSLEGLPENAMPGGAPELQSAWDSMGPERQEAIDRAYANIGKAIAAFERTVAPETTRFDRFAAAMAEGDTKQAESLLSESERAGLKLFLGQDNCVTCHGGPLFTDNAFHNLGLPGADPDKEAGRSTAVALLQQDRFNCLGTFSDAEPAQCSELRFMETTSADLVGAFRSPSLRGAAQRAPYTHRGQFATLADVVRHYNDAPAAVFGKSELKPLGLTAEQLADIEAFIRTLDVGTTAAAAQ